MWMRKGFIFAADGMDAGEDLGDGGIAVFEISRRSVF